MQLLRRVLLVAARIARGSVGGSATVTALVVDGRRAGRSRSTRRPRRGVESWDDAAAGPLRLGVEEPLERWTLSLDAPGVRVDLELRRAHRAGRPRRAADRFGGRAAGLHRYTQLCQAEGSAEIAGRRRAVDAMAAAHSPLGPVGRGRPRRGS